MSDLSDRNGRRNAAYVLIAIAAYLVLASTGLLDFFGIRDLLRFFFRTLWNLVPLGLVVLGAIWLGRAESGERPLFPWFLVIFGAVLLISQFGLFGLNFGDMFLPLWLVFIALVIMNPRNVLPRNFNTQTDDVTEETTKVQLLAFMGGGEINYTSQMLTGGEITAVWGGFQIDFTNAEIAEDTLSINMYCIMGGCEIIVPPHWEVENQAFCVMGGFSNKTNCLADQLELPRKKLVIRGLALMGGGEIRN